VLRPHAGQTCGRARAYEAFAIDAIGAEEVRAMRQRHPDSTNYDGIEGTHRLMCTAMPTTKIQTVDMYHPQHGDS
jgi:hypothetical protein